MNKPDLLRHLGMLLAAKEETLWSEIIATRDTFTSDTKSSAGDKHEVGRAMVQQELDQQEAQLAKLQSLLEELARVPMDRVYDRVGFGSLVATDQGSYFIAIGLGQVEVKGEPCFAVSLASPIGQALKDKHVGDVVSFHGKTISVQRIT